MCEDSTRLFALKGGVQLGATCVEGQAVKTRFVDKWPPWRLTESDYDEEVCFYQKRVDWLGQQQPLGADADFIH